MMQEHATALAQVLPSGIPALRPLFQRYFEDVRYPGRLDMRAVEEIWGPLIARGNGSILAEWPMAGARGIVGTTYMRDTFNGELTAMMVFLYVMPECRGQGIGRTLLDQAETDARLRGCTSIVHGHMFTVDEDGGRAIFEKRGYEVIELGFRKRL